ncbi:helix-turn-helix domain-containing protein [Azospirillum halopraeferens]|uniref:helix-turn-helix domain-containing protein n=1 Tax=Azospirillum halopraeferens TaxID=34010 RepID=UPI000A050054|nr:helix-turn-helix domain-containing protein [Azospirillum halopraeferens]
MAERRREKGLTQPALAQRAGVSRATIAALETGAARELGFNKVAMILAALDLDLRIATANRGRPTFEELRNEDRLGDRRPE